MKLLLQFVKRKPGVRSQGFTRHWNSEAHNSPELRFSFLLGPRLRLPAKLIHHLIRWQWMKVRVLVTQFCQSDSFQPPWTVAPKAPLSMEFSRQEYWSGLPFPSLGDLPDPGIEPRSPVLQVDSSPSEPTGVSGQVHTSSHQVRLRVSLQTHQKVLLSHRDAGNISTLQWCS